MTWLFIRFYVGVLAVLFLAWFIHGRVQQQRSDVDLARVIWEAHAGGARLVADTIDQAAEEERDEIFRELQEQFAYPVRLLPSDKTPESVQEQFSQRDVGYYREGDRHFVISQLSCEPKCAWLGPFPSYRLKEIEDAIGGWMTLSADRLRDTSRKDWPAEIQQLRELFQVTPQLVDFKALPQSPQRRIARGERVVFYEQQPGTERYYSATPLTEDGKILRFGPFPNFQHIEQKAATTTLALVLLPAALAIAVLIRPVVRQLHLVEDAAMAIAAGDLNARVDENRVHAAKPMANAFNLMADRTQSMVKSQRELLQAVSHELRTPLARIRFAADLLETAKSDQERSLRLKAVDDATQQLDDLVGELLTYVRTDSGAGEVEPEDVSISEMLDEAIEVHAQLHPSVRFERTGSSDATLHTDRAGLQRAVSNLIRNAARFAKSKVMLSAEKTGTNICIYVDDDGPGVDENDRERIFQPFVRVDNDTNVGSGLGLALVQRIVAKEGGYIHIDTSPIGGARFAITLTELDESSNHGSLSDHGQPDSNDTTPT